jgi:trimeric autotransporter adhesin
MMPTPALKSSRLTLGALLLAAMVLAPAAAFASTAANTVITNTASVSYNDAGGAAQTPVTASATVTVTLVPAAVAISSPPNQTIGQGTSATLSYTVTANANGPDTYNLTSTATPANVSGVTPSLPANIVLGGTTLAADAVNGVNSITVPYDNSAAVTLNGIAVGSTVVIGGNAYVVASITKNAGANTASIGLASAIAGGTVTAGSIVGERKTFTETVASGTVTSGSSGTQTVSTTATSASSPNPAATQATPTVITVNRPTLTVTKLVSTDGGVTFGASGSAAPGTTLIYKITASNTGATAASQVAFTDVVPAYLLYTAGSGKFATSSATAYSAATALTEGAGGYNYTAGTTTVAYNPGGATGTVAGGGVLVLFFEAKIN